MLRRLKYKAYIPLQRKTIRVGSWLRPQTPQFWVGYTNMLVSKTLKFALPQTRNIKFASPPTQIPNAAMEYNVRLLLVPNAKCSRWPCTFLFFGVDFICVGSRFSVEYGLNILWQCIQCYITYKGPNKVTRGRGQSSTNPTQYTTA